MFSDKMCLCHEYLKPDESMETMEVLGMNCGLLPLSFCWHETEIQTQVYISGLFSLGREVKKEILYADPTVKAYFHRNSTRTQCLAHR